MASATKGSLLVCTLPFLFDNRPWFLTGHRATQGKACISKLLLQLGLDSIDLEVGIVLTGRRHVLVPAFHLPAAWNSGMMACLGSHLTPSGRDGLLLRKKEQDGGSECLTWETPDNALLIFEKKMHFSPASATVLWITKRNLK